MALECRELIDAVLEIAGIHTGQHLTLGHHITFIDEERFHHPTSLGADIHPSNGFQFAAGCDHARQRPPFRSHGELAQLTRTIGTWALAPDHSTCRHQNSGCTGANQVPPPAFQTTQACQSAQGFRCGPSRGLAFLAAHGPFNIFRNYSRP